MFSYIDNIHFEKPNILWFLFLTLVPIIIHLINTNKYYKTPFSDVSLISEIVKRSKKRTRLNNLILLILRTLFVMLLVLAFSKPYFKTSIKSFNIENKNIIIFDNNSYTSIKGKDGDSYHNKMKIALNSFLNSLPKNSKNLFIDNNTSLFDNNTPLSINELKALIENNSVALHTKSKNNFKDEIKKFNKNSNIILVSNRFKTIDFVEYSSSVLYINVDYDNNYENISIDSVWFSEKNEYKTNEVDINFIINNNTLNNLVDYEVRLYDKLYLKQKMNIDIGKKQTKAFSIKVNLNENTFGKLEVDDYRFFYDNTYYYNIHVKDKNKVLNIGNENSVMKVLFDNDLFIYNNTSKDIINYSKIVDYDVLIISSDWNFDRDIFSHIEKFLNKGGSIILFPNYNTKEISSNFKLPTFLKEKINKQNFNTKIDNILYTNLLNNTKGLSVDLPKIKNYNEIIQGEKKIKSYLYLENDIPIIFSCDYKKGDFIYINQSLLKKSDLFSHSIFPSVMYYVLKKSFLDYNINFLEYPMVIKTKKNYYEGLKVKNKTGTEYVLNQTAKNMFNYSSDILPGNYIYSLKNKKRFFSFNVSRIKGVDFNNINNNSLEIKHEEYQNYSNYLFLFLLILLVIILFFEGYLSRI